jgi:hypothetical protein
MGSIIRQPTVIYCIQGIRTDDVKIELKCIDQVYHELIKLSKTKFWISPSP